MSDLLIELHSQVMPRVMDDVVILGTPFQLLNYVISHCY